MIELSTVVIAVLAGLFYRWVVNRQNKNVPDKCEGPQDHSSMPEMKYVQPLEAMEFDASKFLAQPGTGAQIGVFGENVRTV